MEYHHSYMHHDSQLYYLPHPSTHVETNYKAAEASEWMRPMSKMKPSSVVEVVANWHFGKYLSLRSGVSLVFKKLLTIFPSCCFTLLTAFMTTELSCSPD